MEQKQVNLNEVYELIKKIQIDLIEIKKKLDKQNIIYDWDDVKILADEKVLAEGWSSKEDDEAFAYLQ